MWILATVSGVLLCCVLVFCIPVDVMFRIEKDAGAHSRVRIGWMFGLIGKDLGGKKAEPAAQKGGRKNRMRNARVLWAMMRTRGFLRKFLRLCSDSVHLLHIKRFELHLLVGMGDPTETGLLCAGLWPVLAYGNRLALSNIHIHPDFAEANLRGYAVADIRTTPIRFVGPVTRFLFSLTTLRAVKAMVAAWRK